MRVHAWLHGFRGTEYCKPRDATRRAGSAPAIAGRSKIETTQIYLRRLDNERQMERVRDLSWGARFGDFPVKAPGGFEPPYEALQASA
jgi:hypothetical protein